MPELTAKRTLVKSPPELWEELSEVERLAKHLGAFGEIKITKLDPEHTVAWEGEHASGTVSIEPAGWGTRVTFTAEVAGEPEETSTDAEPFAEDGEVDAQDGDVEASPDEEPSPPELVAPPANEPGPEPEGTAAAEPPTPEAPAATDNPPPRRRGFWARLFSGWLVPEERLHRRAVEPTPLHEAEVAAPVSAEPEAPAHEPGSEEADVVSPAAGTEGDDAPADELDSVEADSPAKTGDIESPEPVDADHVQSVLDNALDTLGSAHHRPFSRG
jgi:hypothetical protein